jgi:hypothetical protein
MAVIAGSLGLAIAMVSLLADLHAAVPSGGGDRDSERGAVAETVGARLYNKGIGADGRSLVATVQGDITVSAADMPCVNCHRRSGWGTTEGSVTTPPVVGRMLFEPLTLGNAQIGVRTSGAGTRPAYDVASLERLLRDGIDPTGRRLSSTMPRYDVSARDTAALAAYLRGLSADVAAGVDATTLHLATISVPGVRPGQREAAMSVLRAFADAKNSETRHETRRRERAPWDMKSHYQLYRRWQLHEWTLEGPPATWRQQLERRYAQQPIYAVVGGISNGDWAPIHAFCEEAGIPCLFPQTPAPPLNALHDFYSIYFSPGLLVEASSLASAGPGLLGQGRTLQVARCGSVGAAAAEQLERAMKGRSSSLTTRCVTGDTDLTAEAWAARLEGRPTSLALWLTGNDLEGLGTLADRGGLAGVEHIILSASLVGADVEAIPRGLRGRSLWLNPAVAPDLFADHAGRSLAWLKRRGLDASDRASAVNALFAASLLADAVAMPRVLESREYLIEQLEHMVGRVPMRSAYPTTSLGPSRRFASLGCAIERIPTEPGGRFVAVTPWSIPEIPSREER